MAFHSYAQVIRKLFNAYRFGPPTCVTTSSSCPCVDHSVSRLPPPTKRPIRTRFRSGSVSETLSLAGDGNSQVHYAKGTPSPHWVAPTACRRMVSGSFSLLCPRCFSPFPHGTGSLSVTGEYLGLEGGPPRFPPGFTCPAVLRYHNAQPDRFCLRGSNPVSQAFPDLSTTAPVSYCAQDRQILYVWPYNTDGANPAGHRRTSVWPHPRSLATTRGISVDFSSSAYLDVSVQRVIPLASMGSKQG